MAEVIEKGVVVSVEYRNISQAGYPPMRYIETVIDIEKSDKTHETVTMNGQVSLKNGEQIELIYRESESFFGKVGKKLVGLRTNEFYLNTEEKKRPTIRFRFGS